MTSKEISELQPGQMIELLDGHRANVIEIDREKNMLRFQYVESFDSVQQFATDVPKQAMMTKEPYSNDIDPMQPTNKGDIKTSNFIKEGIEIEKFITPKAPEEKRIPATVFCAFANLSTASLVK
jgi:hypothetical protein